MTTGLILAWRSLLLFTSIFLLLFISFVPGAEGIDYSKENLSDRYAVNLRSSKSPVNVSDIPPLDILKTHRLYTTQLLKGDVVWHRLRLGFFSSNKNAQKALVSLKSAYPDAWVTKVSKLERIDSFESAIALSRRSLKDILQESRLKIEKKIREVSKESKEIIEKKLAEMSAALKERKRLAGIRNEADGAMRAGNYKRAITLYKELADSQGYSGQQRATEFLGLAYEGKNDIKSAKRVYKEYLALYKEGKGKARVSQRLVELETGKVTTRKKIVAHKGSKRGVGPKEKPSDRYAVSLLSSTVPIGVETIARVKIFDEHRLYTTTFKKGGTVWHRLRLGFFPTRKAAQKALTAVRKDYPDSWVTKVSPDERVKSAESVVAFRTPMAERLVKLKDKVSERVALLLKSEKSEDEATATVEPVKEQVGAPGTPLPQAAKGTTTIPATRSNQRLSRMMEEAEVAMTGGKYGKAIGLYQDILQSQANPYQQSAREFIALAFEKRGQTDKAIAEYRGYLVLYPKSNEAVRVRQRLAGLETARATPKKRLAKVKKRRREGTEFYGSFAQFYNRDQNYTDLGGKILTSSTLSSDLDLNVRKRGSNYDLRSVLIGGYDYNFIGDGSDNEFRLSRFYLDIYNREREVKVRLGRQSRSDGGVLGRFDGGLIQYPITPVVNMNLVTGFPVESSIVEKVDTDKHFYGASFDIGTFYKYWDVNAFFITQQADGITDRKSVGGEIRYFHPDRSFFNLVDYDLSYGKLNTMLFVGNWTLADKSSFNVAVDYRSSPILTTSNALQGQAATDLAELMQSFTEDEVRSLALDRTATNKSFTVGYTTPLKDTRFQLSNEATISELEGTDASGGVDAVAGTGLEYFLSSQLIGASIVKEGDMAIVGLRYSDTSTSNTLSLNLNTRYPATRALRINPRMRVDYRTRDDGSEDRWVLRPSLRTDYYWRKKRLHLEFEAGGDWTYSTIEDSRDYFLLMGYRVDY
ncbi:MAG: SPOR domain-containing protein [Thermodesulfobacteriota bacterium]